MAWNHQTDTSKVVKELKGSFAGNIYMSMMNDPNLDVTSNDLEGLSSQFAEAVVYETMQTMKVDLDDGVRDELESEIKKEMKGMISEMAVDLKKSTHIAYEKHGIDSAQTSFDDALMDLSENGVDLTNEAISNAEFMKKNSAEVLEGVVNKTASTAMVMEKMKEAGIKHQQKPQKEPEKAPEKTKWRTFLKEQFEKAARGSDSSRDR